MDFNEILVDIILNEKYDGEKDIDWLYGEYVKRGYNKSREMFCEEFVMSMNEQEIKYLTEPEVNKVTGGAGKFKKSSTSIALASALLAGAMMPTQGAGVPESRAVVSANISNKHQGKSSQGFYEKATRIVNKIFNDADVRSVLVPVLATVGVPVLGAGTIYLIIRIVKMISEAKTPEEVLQNTAKGINDILNNKQSSNQKDEILTILKACLIALLDFVPKEQQSNLKGLYVEKFGTKETPTVFNNWEEIHKAFTGVLDDVINKLPNQPVNNPLKELFEKPPKNLTEVFDSKEEPKEEQGILEDREVLLPEIDNIFDSTYDVTKVHGSYTTEDLRNNENVSKETGIRREVLDIVDTKVRENPEETLSSYNLTKNVMLVVCKGMKIPETAWAGTLQKLLRDNPGINLYLVLQDCFVDIENTEDTKVKVLDLRGSTRFATGLFHKGSVDKVLMRNQEESRGQLFLRNCKNVGAIYQMSEDERNLNWSRLNLSGCKLKSDFRFVNLNNCCKQLLGISCINSSTCPKENLDEIKTKSFDPKSQPGWDRLRGV